MSNQINQKPRLQPSSLDGPLVVQRKRSVLSLRTFVLCSLLGVSLAAVPAIAEENPFSLGNTAIGTFNYEAPENTQFSGSIEISTEPRKGYFSMNTALGIRKHISRDEVAADLGSDLKDVTFTVTFTGRGLSDERVIDVVETIILARTHALGGLTIDVGARPEEGVKSIARDEDVLGFFATWQEAVEGQEDFVEVNYGYGQNDGPIFFNANAAGGTDSFYEAHFSANPEMMQVSQDWIVPIVAEESLEPEISTMRFSTGPTTLLYGTEETTQLGFKGSMLTNDLSYHAGDSSRWNSDYADMTKRRIGGGGGTSFQF